MRLAPRGPSNTLSLIGYGNLLLPSKCALIVLLDSTDAKSISPKLDPSATIEKGQQHPKDFPGGHPPQYYPGLARLNFGVRKGSGAFDAVWPLTN